MKLKSGWHCDEIEIGMRSGWPHVESTLGVYTLEVYLLGLRILDLETNLWESTLGIYTLGAYSLGMRILDLVDHIWESIP